ncbi:hypothetical protein BCR33DRAFT_711541 [Rhizoclosmatium globosum]|uniref:Uncharacterized protein n=1 Tax=Rhizoclosmatium globosum TaxID=329046 RepID=A0A1Y2D1P0_9FUNG|nr:hypothetical protein BCR33DRAFT_711541 [Rhizoclosmatium globosum]|eukprot:ORY53199.1 hypothetical protein BCR33DRAFT_711541 [Rhizoclosmatium globosum]
MSITPSSFAEYAATSMFDNYTSSTDSYVWWMASQNSTTQQYAIQKICYRPEITLQETLSLYWALNSTFYLSTPARNQMVNCVAEKSKGTAVTRFLTRNPYFPIDIFTWNPYTPKSLGWFTSTNDANRMTGLDCICYDQSLPLSLLAKTMAYYKSSFRFSYNIIHAMDQCLLLSPIVNNPYISSSRAWYSTQSYEVQRNTVIRLCGSSQFDLKSLITIFRDVLVSNNKETNLDVSFCLQTYNWSHATLRQYFPPDTRQSLIWLAAQNATVQAQALTNICFGKTSKQDLKRYSLDEIAEIFKLSIGFLNETATLTDLVVIKPIQCLNYYSTWNFTTAYQTLVSNKATGALDSRSLVWLASQPSETQAEFIQTVCTDYSLDSGLVIRIWRSLGLTVSFNLDTLKQMADCPKVADYIREEKRISNAYIGLASFSELGFVAFIILIYLEVTKLKAKQSVLSRVLSPFNFALCLCFMSNLMNFVCALQLWELHNIAKITFASIWDYQQRWYLSSQVFELMWSLSYLYFCWIRSESILTKVWPRTFFLIKALFYISPLLLVGPLLSQALAMAGILDFKVKLKYGNVSYVLQAVAAITLLILDVLLFSTFTRYLTELTGDIKNAVTTRFRIISRAGLVASLICFCFSALSVVKVFIPDVSIYIKVTTDCLMYAVTLVLLLMKVWLFIDSAMTGKTSNNTGSDKPGA